MSDFPRGMLIYFPGEPGNSRRPDGFTTRQGLKNKYTQLTRELQDCLDGDTLQAFVNAPDTLKVIHNLRVYIPDWYEPSPEQDGRGWVELVQDLEHQLTGTNTMHIGAAFPTEFIKAADLSGGEKTLTISKFAMEEAFDETKPVIHFSETDRKLTLNKTNANMLAELFGHETDNWAGKKVTLYVIMTEYQGKPTQGLRIKAPEAPVALATQAPAPPSDEIPF